MNNSKYQEALDRVKEIYIYIYIYLCDEFNLKKLAVKMNDDIEVLQELVDKATPKKPFYEADGYDENGELIYDTWICPNCNHYYEVDYDDYDYCPNCGQRLE